MVHGSDRQFRSACPRGLPKGARRRIFALPLPPAYLRFAGTALRLTTLACEFVSPTPLEVERAAYVWRLQCDHHILDKQLADLRVIFQWLLQIHAGDTTMNLIRARAAYVAELYAEKHDLDTEIADLAKLHDDLIAAELDRTSAFCTPRRRRCRQRLRVHDPGATSRYSSDKETALG